VVPPILGSRPPPGKRCIGMGYSAAE